MSGKSLLTGRRAIPAKICAPCLAPRVFPSRFLSRGKLGLARTISLEKRSSRRRGPDRGCCRRGEGVDPKSGAAEKKGANLPDETSCENSEHVSRVYVIHPRLRLLAIFEGSRGATIVNIDARHFRLRTISNIPSPLFAFAFYRSCIR